jgi:hypothetical protein
VLFCDRLGCSFPQDACRRSCPETERFKIVITKGSGWLVGLQTFILETQWWRGNGGNDDLQCYLHRERKSESSTDWTGYYICRMTFHHSFNQVMQAIICILGRWETTVHLESWNFESLRHFPQFWLDWQKAERKWSTRPKVLMWILSPTLEDHEKMGVVWSCFSQVFQKFSAVTLRSRGRVDMRK